MPSSTSLSSLTDGLDELPYRESSPDDSHCPTTPMQRAFNGDVQAEASGKRVRPDNTSRGIGPQSVEVDAKTMDVSSADLVPVSKDTSLSELRVPFMHSDLRFLVFIGLGALALIGSMLLLMTRGEEPVNAITAEPMAPVAAPAPALVAEPVATPEPTPAVAPLAAAEPAVAAPVAPEKPRATAKRRVRSSKVAAAKLSTRSTVKATTKTKAKAKKSRTRTQPAVTR